MTPHAEDAIQTVITVVVGLILTVAILGGAYMWASA